MSEDLELHKEESTEEEFEEQVLFINGQHQEDPRIVGLYGELNEETARVCVRDFLLIHENGKEEDEEGNVTYKPFEFIVSTEGGHVTEMFAIYDVMRRIQAEGTEIHTFGLGKVMSAGVLLLAGGTKGSRRIGKHTQVMIHDISSGHFGSMKEIQNDTKQIKKMRDIYIECLMNETKITKTRITRYFNKHVDIYLSAQEALELGIVDEIV
jgi:ATP-dependent Clp protease protease subunit